MLSGGLSGAVNGFWQVADADQGQGVADFTSKGNLWKKRRSISKDFWGD
jgi:enoyl-CoA hydratase